MLTLTHFQGVPIRVEIGPRDVKNHQFVAVVRDTSGTKETIPNDQAVQKIREMLEAMHQRLFDR